MPELGKNEVPINIEDIMHTAYLQYSLSVNVGRAIPEVRDGLKPCNRRILYAMRQLGLTKSHATVKCAKVVGAVLGSYHPHGDSSVYDALARMAQNFSMREPLIEGQGNFGSIDGDPPAAYRYTECRLERLSEELLADIDKDTVDMIPTFDEEAMEPEVLPAKFPNLLVNGSVGIGVGMATNIPPHNLAEVIDATIHLMENPTATARELMRFLPGPDFPTGAIICGVDQIRSLYETGHGVLKIRAKAKIEEREDGREQIIVTEIPYALNKELMVKKIADVVSEKRVTGVSGLRDESNKKGIRIVIDIKRGAMANIVLNQLYSNTQMESVLGCNMLVVDHNRPRVMNLPQILQAFIDHRFDVVTRRAKFELAKALKRAHILEGLLVAVRNIDEVVKIIRESRARDEAAAALRARFELDQAQSDAILDMRLHQLTGLAIEDLEAQYAELRKQIASLEELLASREKRMELIKTELSDVKRRFGSPRRTEITFDESDLDIADLIPRHSCVVTVSDTGYIKRVPADTYRTQHRGGVGVIGMETKEEDHVAKLFSADSHDLIFFITDRGFMHWLNVYDIPEGARTGKGKAIINLIKLQQGEQVCAMLTLNREMFERPEISIVMATRRGIIKKTPLSAFKNLRKVGIRALIIEENDDLVSAELADGSSEIILSTAKGMACRFSEIDVRPMGRAARGVTGIKFKLDDDYIVGMEVIPTGELPVLTTDPELADAIDAEEAEIKERSSESLGPDDVESDEAAEDFDDADANGDEEEVVDDGRPQLLVVTSGGMGKRSLVESYRLTRRGAKGVKNVNLADGEVVVAAIQVKPTDEVLITTERGQIVRTPVKEIRLVGRNSKGVRIMNLRKNDRITGASTLMEVKADEASAAKTEPEVFASSSGIPETDRNRESLEDLAEEDAMNEEARTGADSEIDGDANAASASGDAGGDDDVPF